MRDAAADFTTTGFGRFPHEILVAMILVAMSKSKTRKNSSKMLKGSGQSAGIVEIDSDIQISLVEIIRALARSAAREDHRKAREVEAASLRRQADETRSDLRPFFDGTTARTLDRRPSGGV
ncbi:MAG: hypothetical protein C3F11_18375, partial [Methylocystaceae bacterium]